MSKPESTTTATKPKGHFSHRHVTRQAHDEARTARAVGQFVQVCDLRLRVAERNVRSPQQQLAELDDRLGAGIGAVSERARLRLLIEAETLAA